LAVLSLVIINHVDSKRLAVNNLGDDILISLVESIN